ncbi:hypothetical protein [Streptomyces sp. P9-2]|uniref:hypothetical protein n=1 Tax=Streptomyces sp. P9-2 TaxID=3423201 RepID=UPI003358FAAC
MRYGALRGLSPGAGPYGGRLTGRLPRGVGPTRRLPQPGGPSGTLPADTGSGCPRHLDRVLRPAGRRPRLAGVMDVVQAHVEEADADPDLEHRIVE